MLTVHNFSYGLLTPVLAYVMSCLGAFIALRCATRAYAHQGRARARWLLLAAVSLGVTGIWVMHFIAMLGYTIPGQIIHYSIPITIFSMLIAVIVVAGGLLIVGFGKPNWLNLLLAGLITGIGVASMHYSGMMAMEVHGRMTYRPSLFAASVVIAVVACTAALWAALRLRGLWHTLGASLIMGAAVSGMHYTGMAAMQMHGGGASMAMNGPTAEGFLLPLIVGIGVISIVMTGALVFSPTSEEIQEDAELMARINAANARLAGQPPLGPLPPAPRSARWPGLAGGPPASHGPAAGSPMPNGSGPPHGANGRNETAHPPGTGHQNGIQPAPKRQLGVSPRKRRPGR